MIEENKFDSQIFGLDIRHIEGSRAPKKLTAIDFL